MQGWCVIPYSLAKLGLEADRQEMEEAQLTEACPADSIYKSLQDKALSELLYKDDSKVGMYIDGEQLFKWSETTWRVVCIRLRRAGNCASVV